MNFIINWKNVGVMLIIVLVIGGAFVFIAKQMIEQKDSASVQSLNMPSGIKKTSESVGEKVVPIMPAVKFYQNQKYGFSFSYPGNYKTQATDTEQDSPGGVIYVLQLGDETVADFETDFERGITITVRKIEAGTPLADDHLAEPNGMDPISQKDILINGLKWRVYNQDEGGVYVVTDDKYTYTISAGSEANKTTKDNFPKILASFKLSK